MQTSPRSAGQDWSPLVSVIVVTRNAATALGATLQCLQQQTWRRFEVILIDGASSDGTMAVAAGFGDLITNAVSEPDSGIADAWNKGVQRARGAWLIFLNAGDLLHARHFERAESLLLQRGGRRIVFCDVLMFDAEGKPGRTVVGQAPSAAGIRRGGVGFGHPGSFTSRDAFDHVGLFDTTLKIAIDTDFLLRCYQANCSFERLTSVAYMAEGGLSDRHFGRGMREYFACAERLGLVSTTQARWLAILLPIARRALHGLRRRAFPNARLLKHLVVAAVNLLTNLLPLAALRRAWFRLLGFDVAPGTSIGMGLRFYRCGHLQMGPRSVINRDCLLDNRAPIVIGCDVSIARNVSIFTAGHDPDSPFFEMTTAAVAIGDHAVLFADVRVMPGVSIGRGAVVHAGSLVTQDVPAMAVVAGVPARPVRLRLAAPLYQLDYAYPLAM